MISIIRLAFLVCSVGCQYITIRYAPRQIQKGDNYSIDGTISFYENQTSTGVRVYQEFQDPNGFNPTNEIANSKNGVTVTGGNTFGIKTSFSYDGLNFKLYLDNVPFSNVYIYISFGMEYIYNNSYGIGYMGSQFFVNDNPTVPIFTANATKLFEGESIGVVGKFYIPPLYNFSSIICYKYNDSGELQMILSSTNKSTGGVTELGKSIFGDRIRASISGSSYLFAVSNLRVNESMALYFQVVSDFKTKPTTFYFSVSSKTPLANNSNELHLSSIVALLSFAASFFGLSFQGLSL